MRLSKTSLPSRSVSSRHSDRYWSNFRPVGASTPNGSTSFLRPRRAACVSRWSSVMSAGFARLIQDSGASSGRSLHSRHAKKSSTSRDRRVDLSALSWRSLFRQLLLPAIIQRSRMDQSAVSRRAGCLRLLQQRFPGLRSKKMLPGSRLYCRATQLTKAPDDNRNPAARREQRFRWNV